MQKAAADLGWDVLTHVREDAIDEVERDVQRLAGAGIRAIERDIESEIAEKRREITQLKRTLDSLARLAEKDEEAFPTEMTYRYTKTRGKDEYFTKEEELLVEDAGSAEAAARKIEKRLDRFARLRDQMVERLKQKRQTVREAQAEVETFVQGTDRLVAEVLATLT